MRRRPVQRLGRRRRRVPRGVVGRGCVGRARASGRTHAVRGSRTSRREPDEGTGRRHRFGTGPKGHGALLACNPCAALSDESIFT